MTTFLCFHLYKNSRKGNSIIIIMLAPDIFKSKTKSVNMLPNIDIQKQKLFNKEKIEKDQAPGNLEFGTFC